MTREVGRNRRTQHLRGQEKRECLVECIAHLCQRWWRTRDGPTDLAVHPKRMVLVEWREQCSWDYETMAGVENMGNKRLCCKGEQRNGKFAAEGRGAEMLSVFAFR